MPQPAYRFTDHAKSRALRVRPGLAESADADHDQARIDRRQFGVTEAPLFEGARPEIFDEHVALRHQLADQALALGVVQVHRNKGLVPKNARGVERASIEALAHLAHGVASRSFDLDHFS